MLARMNIKTKHGVWIYAPEMPVIPWECPQNRTLLGLGSHWLRQHLSHECNVYIWTFTAYVSIKQSTTPKFCHFILDMCLHLSVTYSPFLVVPSCGKSQANHHQPSNRASTPPSSLRVRRRSRSHFRNLSHRRQLVWSGMGWQRLTPNCS